MKPNDETRSRLLKEAVRIGEQLLTEAKTGDNGMSWETMGMDEKQEIYFQETTSIYSGVAGISLFFLELYKQTKDDRYMNAAKEGMKWVLHTCRTTPTPYYAFFTGQMGIPYVLLQMYHATGSKDYIDPALEIARGCDEFIKFPNSVDDLINGSSGALLGLMHLHSVTGETWILNSIDQYIRHLLEAAHLGPEGLYWDRTGNHISGLCGFSHGAAGIGFVFLELGHYFNNDALYKLGEQAFIYEEHFYNKETMNWPDLRRGIFSDDDFEKHKEAFLKDDKEFFTKGHDMNAWCHGAAGVGLSRLRAWQLLKNPKYLEDSKSAVQKTTLTDIESEHPITQFIVCHGGGGNADLFIYAYEILGDEKYLALAEKTALNAIGFHEKNNIYIPGFPYRGEDTKEDRSLFMGYAGIGYFLLRLLDPRHVKSIQAPTLEATLKDIAPDESLSQYPFISISPDDIHKRLLKKNFERSLFICESQIPGKLNSFFQTHPLTSERTGDSLKEPFVKFMEETIPTLTPGQKERVSEVFQLELEKRALDESAIGFSWLSIRDKIAAKEAEEMIGLEGDGFINLTLQLVTDVRVGITQWNWNFSNQENWESNMETEPDDWPLLMKPLPTQVMEAELTPFSYTVLNEFENPNPVKNAIRTTFDAYEDLNPEQEEMLKGKIIQQIKQALQSGILIRPKP
ncbi:MAG: hypothetical protein GY940_39685 [bacterium]|nr:hypothetical protein [bacterium]